MKKMNKKAMARIVVKILVVLLVGSILFFAAKEQLSAQEEIYNEGTCRLTVNARSAILEGTGIMSVVKRLPALKCKTNEICLKKGGTCPDEDDPDYTKINIENKEAIKKKIADLMIECWEMLEKGEKQFLRKSTETQCVTCSVIQFDDKIQSEYKTIEDMNKYLFDKSPTGKDYTYIEFITEEENPDIGEMNIDTSVETAIVYLVGKDMSEIEKWGSEAIDVGILVTKIIPGIKVETEQAVSLRLVQYKVGEISKVCKNMKNII